MTDSFNPMVEHVSSCNPCSNDLIGFEVNEIKNVMKNNLNILNAFKNMKCAVLAYINAVSVEFVQNIDFTEEPLERIRFNVLIESLIAGIHQAMRTNTDGVIEPYFQLWIQSGTTYNIGAGWIDGTTASGCYDENGDSTTQTYDECINDTNSVWYGRSHDVQYVEGNIAKLYPSKISLFTNCSKENGAKGDEILYHYNPSVQLLYDKDNSSLYLKWSDATYNGSLQRHKKCLFPLLNDTASFKTQVFEIVPPSPVDTDGTDIWDTQESAFNFIRQDCLLENEDVHTLINRLELIIRKCELTHQSLKLKLQMASTKEIDSC